MIPDLTPTEIRRFYSKVVLGGCGLVWTGETNNHGYGRFPVYRNYKRIRILTHRLSYLLATGEDPGPAVIRHGCDTPACCTPDCLVTGTQLENIHDAKERGRMDLSGLFGEIERRDAEVRARIARGEKRCGGCEQLKRLTDFHRNKSSIDGRAHRCAACAAAAGRVRAERDRLRLERAS